MKAPEVLMALLEDSQSVRDWYTQELCKEPTWRNMDMVTGTHTHPFLVLLPPCL